MPSATISMAVLLVRATLGTLKSAHFVKVNLVIDINNRKKTLFFMKVNRIDRRLMQTNFM